MRKWYNNKAVAKTTEKISQNPGQKFFKEILKKVLTREKESDIIDKRSQKGRDWNLTIEQQKIEVQSKIKSKCEYKICQNQREHNSKKVKKARINSSNESNR